MDPLRVTPAGRKRDLTLSEYVRRRNGVAMGAPGSLSNMLARSLGAGSFGEFWRYWNPIWGYGLGKYVFAPLKKALPPALALVATFVVSGALHDLATMLACTGTDVDDVISGLHRFFVVFNYYNSVS